MQYIRRKIHQLILEGVERRLMKNQGARPPHLSCKDDFNYMKEIIYPRSTQGNESCVLFCIENASGHINEINN